MEISRDRTIAKKSGKASEMQKARLNLDLNVLDLLCSYVMSTNRNIRRSHFTQLKNLMNCLDYSVYESSPEKRTRLDFISRVLVARMDKGLSDKRMIMMSVSGVSSDTKDFDDFKELNNNELEFINQTISGALASAYIESDVDRGLEILTRYKASDYKNSDKIINEWKDYIAEQNTKIRNARSESLTDRVFSLDKDNFENVVSDIYDTVTSPFRMLRCGMQGINSIVAGFEATRVYALLGLAGVGKSMILLNLALQFKKYNKGYQTKDPLKQPALLFLTMENTVDETVDRICGMVTGKNLSKYSSKKEMIQALKSTGELELTDDDNINIFIIYKPDRSIDTGALYDIVDDLEQRGYEIIALFLDHLKRIRSVYNISDIRLELGAVVNELKIFAAIKQCAVVTVSHLNRDAATKIDSGVTSNKGDLLRVLGRSNIGESMLILDNIDCMMLVQVEYDRDGNKFMTFKCVKIRNVKAERDFVCIPFEKGNDMKLVEDYYDLVPSFRESLVDDIKPKSNSMNGVNMKPSVYTNIHQLDCEEENIFMLSNSSTYSSVDVLSQQIPPMNIPRILPASYSISDEDETVEEEVVQSVQPTPLIVFRQAS